ncbi:unnamed protein product, partial [Rotaria sp. Silwood1]
GAQFGYSASNAQGIASGGMYPPQPGLPQTIFQQPGMPQPGLPPTMFPQPGMPQQVPPPPGMPP